MEVRLSSLIFAAFSQPRQVDLHQIRPLPFAKSLLDDVKASDEERLRQANIRALGRAPSPDELVDALAFLRSYREKVRSPQGNGKDSLVAAWQSYCQTLLCANEFFYID
jgi:hypothetical protein